MERTTSSIDAMFGWHGKPEGVPVVRILLLAISMAMRRIDEASIGISMWISMLKAFVYRMEESS